MPKITTYPSKRRGIAKIQAAKAFAKEVLAVSANATVASNVYRYINTGGAITLTLPDPTLCKGTTHVILNHGTSVITFNYPVTIDKLTTITQLDFAYPDNTLTIFSDGTKWIGHKQ